MWTRSCCASLLGLLNRFSQCLQTCTVAPGAGIGAASPGSTSDALLDAVASAGCCRATRWAAGRRGMTLAVSVVLGSLAAVFPGPLFALVSGAFGSADDRLRLRCFGGKLPSALIVPRMQQVWQRR